MNRSVLIVLGVLVLVAGWFFVSPLFIDRAVDESFEFVLENGELDMQGIMAMPPDKQLAMMPEIMDAAAKAPDQSATDAMPVDGPQAVARGEFIDADAIHKGSGRATLYELPDGSNLVRFEDFRTTNGPALVVYLAKHASPTEARHVSDGGYVSLGKLKGNVGNQNYVIPPGTDIGEYNSVVIWCELFGVLFSPAALTRT
jgi:hypothetical protein